MQDIYPSRTDRGSAILARQDPVVYGDGQFADALNSEHLGSYEKNGFLVIRELFSDDETLALFDEVQRLLADPDIAGLEEAITEPGSETVRTEVRVHEINERIDALSSVPRL